MSNATRVARNTIANWAGTLTGSLVILFLTPYVLGALGDERFGVYAVARDSLIYVNLLTLGMRESVTRFACQRIAAKDEAGLNAVLSTVCVLFLIVGVLGLTVCGVLGLLAPAFLGVHPGYAAETSLLFLVTGANFLLGLMGQTYSGVLIGHQRYDLLNLGNILREISRAALVVIVFTLGWKTLGGFAVALLLAYVMALVYFWRISHHQQPHLHVNPVRADARVARQVLGFGIWNALVQIGNVITFATPTLIVAKALGPDQVVFYAVPFMLADRIRLVVAGMANTLTPMAAATLTTGDRDHFRTLVVKGTRVAAAIGLPIGLILLVMCKPFLRVWMGPEYAWSWIVYAIVMIAMAGRITQAPTLWILIGGGQIRGLAVMQMAAAVATVILTITLVTQTTLGVVAVAIGITVPLFISHSVFLPWYVARQANLTLRQYFRQSYFRPALSALAGLGTVWIFTTLWAPTGWAPLITGFAVSFAVSGITAWFTCFDRPTRALIMTRLGLG